MPRLGNQDSPFWVHPHYPDTLSKDQLDEPGIAAGSFGELTRKVGRLDVGQIDRPSLHLGHDLLRNDHNVSVFQRSPLSFDCV